MGVETVKKEPYLVLVVGGEGEIEEKKSRFIGQTFPITSEEEASEIIEKTKKKYWDARHNCYAFVLGERGQVARSSDDGEPSGTAGRPILEVLQGQGIRNCLIVVTRYFGGTLLGTGGLVRAYTDASKEALANSQIGRMRFGHYLRIDTDYNGFGKIQYLLGERGISIDRTEYTDAVSLWFWISEEERDAVQKEITTVTMGKAVITSELDDYYPEMMH